MVEAVEERFEHLEPIGGERSGLSRLLGVADLQDEVAGPRVGVERLGAAGAESRVLHAGGIQSREEVGANSHRRFKFVRKPPLPGDQVQLLRLF